MLILASEGVGTALAKINTSRVLDASNHRHAFLVDAIKLIARRDVGSVLERAGFADQFGPALTPGVSGQFGLGQVIKAERCVYRVSIVINFLCLSCLAAWVDWAVAR